MISFSLIVCFILGLASLVYPFLVKHAKDKDGEDAKTIMISLILFLGGSLFGNIFIAILEDTASVQDAGGFLLKLEGIMLFIYILSQYFLQRKGSRTALVIVSLTAIIGYLSQYVTVYHAMIGAKWITDEICEMSDLTQIVVMIGIVEVIFIILIQKMFTNHSFDTNKRV
ncbi:hypothetical protein [Kallipyga gabonensis]|uniref:hypothetical protein n=1 Tax=Kallipyga gabonensis TaxID=1686287 RepID=UPI0006B4D3C8|nr:hypothetical protein [Kallipyga gabonensis]